MSSEDEFLNDKQLKKLDRKLQSIISRVGFDKKTESEVFDRHALLTLGKLMNDGVIDIIDFPISTGKEGNVFRGTAPDGSFIAVKIYRISTNTFKHLSEYIIGDPRFKSIHKTRRDILFAWTQKEFKNLERLEKNGVPAPRPITYKNNILVMSYIGDETSTAPLLKDIKIENPKELFETLISYVDKMYNKANLVHGDLSVFNILMHEDKPYIIDLGQGVLIEHPQADDFLKRDIRNLVKFFNKYNIRADEKQTYNDIVKK